MTLVEVVIALAIGTVIFGGVLTGYIQSSKRAEWSAYNLAGYSMSMQHLEMARAAKWDTQSVSLTDNLVSSNFPVTVEVLDVPVRGSNLAYATNTVFIKVISADPPLKMVRVETVWSFRDGRTFTNSAATYRAPDQ